jgi:hypothetical protein
MQCQLIRLCQFAATTIGLAHDTNNIANLSISLPAWKLAEGMAALMPALDLNLAAWRKIGPE